MNGYKDFSRIYDNFTNDIDYKGRTDYLCGLFSRYGQMPTLLLDLACGSGGFSLEFAKHAVDVIGVDVSEEMLALAREKAEKEKLDIMFLCQDAEALDLYGTVDGAVCCLDSVNHITDEEKLSNVFSKVSLFLEPQKLFIFDVNTVYKHEKVLADNTFIREDGDVFLVWQNEYEKEDNITDIYLDFFIKNGERYERFSEDFSERAYTDEKLKELLSKAGFETVAVFGDMTESEPDSDSERNIYVARKVK